MIISKPTNQDELTATVYPTPAKRIEPNQPETLSLSKSNSLGSDRMLVL